MANKKAKSAGKSKHVASLKLLLNQEDPAICRLHWDFFRQCMSESRDLSNIGVETTFALHKGLKELDEKNDGTTVNPRTQVYRDMARHRKLLAANVVNGLSNNVDTMYRNSVKYRQGIPKFRSGTIPIASANTKLWSAPTTWEDKKGKTRHGTGYFLSSKFHTKMTDEIVQSLIDANAKREKHRKKTSKKETYKPNLYPQSVSDVPEECRKIVFKGIISKKDDGVREILENVISGQYNMSDSKLTEKDRDVYLKLTWWKSEEEEKPTLDKNRVCGIDMGWNIPMVCASNEGWERIFLGKREEIWHARSRFRSVRSRNQRRKMIAGKSKRESSVSESEKNWIDNYCHNLSKQVIDFCLKNNMGTIHVEDLSSLRAMDGKDSYKRLIWVPCKLQQMLEYKAKAVGIQFHKINPRNTSRTCSSCGHIDKDSRTAKNSFVCTSCEKEFHADYNAARNIAKSKAYTNPLDSEIITEEVEKELVPV